MNRITQLSLLSLTVILAACGGGGGDGQANDADPAASSQSTELATGASDPALGTTVASTATPTSTTTVATPSTLPPEQTCGLSNFAQDLINRINQARASDRSCGTTLYKATTPVGWNAKLFNAAAGHALDMATKNYFSHTSLDGRSFSQRITAAGYSWSSAGENIAGGQPTTEQVMNAWLKSPGHCVNIMSPKFTEVAVSCARNSASTYKMYWVMNLARPR